MKITAIQPWFGGKRTMAPLITQQLGPHTSYWEPFCGSMAVLLVKDRASQETVNDMHGDLINLARVLRDGTRGPALYRRLRRLLVHESLYWEEAEKMKASADYASEEEDDDPSTADLERAYTFFVASWLGRNGVIGTKGWNNNFCVRYTKNGGIQGTRFAAAIDSIPSWRQRLRRVTILRRDGLDLLGKIEDAAGTAIYVDPPYLLATRNRNHGSSKYLYEFADSDHDRLAQVLRGFQHARIVVSYYASPRLSSLYPGWPQLQFNLAKGMAMQGNRGSTKEVAEEVLLVNGEIFGEENSLF